MILEELMKNFRKISRIIRESMQLGLQEEVISKLREEQRKMADQLKHEVDAQVEMIGYYQEAIILHRNQNSN